MLFRFIRFIRYVRREQNANVTKSPKVIPKFPAATLSKRGEKLYRHSKGKSAHRNISTISLSFSFCFFATSNQFHILLNHLFCYAWLLLSVCVCLRCVFKLQIHFWPHSCFDLLCFMDDLVVMVVMVVMVKW